MENGSAAENVAGNSILTLANQTNFGGDVNVAVFVMDESDEKVEGLL